MNDDPTETGFHRAFKRRWPQAVWILPFLHYITPALVGAGLATIGGGLVYIFNSPQKDISRVEAGTGKAIADIQQSIAKLVEQSQSTREDVASIKATVGAMKDTEHERWEKIDKVMAEDKAHAARRKR